MQKRDADSRDRFLIYAGLALITLAIYLPALYHGFVEYDDQQYVTENSQVQAGLTWHGLIWAFGFHAGNWHPLTWLSHMLDCQLFGAWAGGHHLTNLVLHTASTLLLFSFLNRMTNTMWRSAVVAALFAWHPLHVESVAWVAERKDVLCGFFWMLTLWFYARYAAQPSVVRHLCALAAFFLCVLSKPMAVTLPFVLLLLDYWPLNRMMGEGWHWTGVWRLVVEKIPFLALAIGGCVLTLQAQQISIVSTAGLPVSERMVHALAAYNHYLCAMFVPRHLAVYYPYQIHLPLLTLVSAAAVTGVVTILSAINFRQRPYLVVGWFWYLGTLMPVIGLVQVGDQAWADRYTYIPLIGLFIMVVWLVCEHIKNRIALQGLAVFTALALTALTSKQLGYWQDTRTLFAHASQVTSNNYLAITVLGSLLAQEHKYAEAMDHYQRALRYLPTYPEAHFYLGNALAEQGRLDAAVSEYQQALWFRPTQVQTHIFMGIALAKQKKYDEAIAHYTAALKLDPDSAVAQNNLARLLHTQGKFDAAIEHYRAALAIDPKLALAHNNLGILLIQKGDFAAGTSQLREALRLSPANTETQLNLALALNQQHLWPEASELFAKTVRHDLPDPNAHFEYAVALTHLQQTRAAMSEYAAALLIRPDFPDALDGLAWILSTNPDPNFRNGTEAVRMSLRACGLTSNRNPEKLKTLAAAYAETGRFELAGNTIRTAQDLAAKVNQPELVNQCSLMLDQFKILKPWRSP